jgi:hypothetical protein
MTNEPGPRMAGRDLSEIGLRASAIADCHANGTARRMPERTLNDLLNISLSFWIGIVSRCGEATRPKPAAITSVSVIKPAHGASLAAWWRRRNGGLVSVIPRSGSW